jgi:hypothetical protein
MITTKLLVLVWRALKLVSPEFSARHSSTKMMNAGVMGFICESVDPNSVTRCFIQQLILMHEALGGETKE